MTQLAGEILTGMDLHVVLLQEFQCFEILALERLCYVIFALHHRTEIARLDHRAVGFLESYIVTDQNMGHSVNTCDVFVQHVETLAELVTNVALDVGGEGPDVVLAQTDAGDVLGQRHRHRVLVLLGECEVSPEHIEGLFTSTRFAHHLNFYY